MRATSTISSTTYDGSHSLIYHACLVLAGTALIALSAQVKLPLLPVPITLQTTAILFLSIIFGPALGATAVAGYLLEGALGLPVFAGFSAGVPILLGQTGGYLIGFLPAAIVSGYLAQKGWNKGIKVFCNVLIGTIILFTPGVIMLSHFVGWHRAYQFGVQIFYVTESAKIIFLAGFLNQFNDYFSFLK